MSGTMTDALSILSAAILPKSPSFVKRPEFSQEVVSQTSCSITQMLLTVKTTTTHSSDSDSVHFPKI